MRSFEITSHYLVFHELVRSLDALEERRTFRSRKEIDLFSLPSVRLSYAEMSSYANRNWRVGTGTPSTFRDLTGTLGTRETEGGRIGFRGWFQ